MSGLYDPRTDPTSPAQAASGRAASDSGQKTDRTHLRGFASLTPERRREIARMGGAAVPADKRSFSQNRQLAQNAGRKGGEAAKTPRTPGGEGGR